MPPSQQAALVDAALARGEVGSLLFVTDPAETNRLQRLAFRLLIRGRRLSIEATKTQATYTLLDGKPLELTHHGKPITVATGSPVTEEIPAAEAAGPMPTQPKGRAPARRGDGDG